MKKIIFSAQIAIFAAALPLYAYLELSHGTNKTEIGNPVQSASVAVASPVEHTVKFPGKINKTSVRHAAKTNASIANATITPAAVKENKICNDTETEEAMLPQFPEWKVSPVKMADVDEKELTEKIIRELRAAFEKDIQVTLEKLKAARMECQGKKQSCPCISL